MKIIHLYAVAEGCWGRGILSSDQDAHSGLAEALLHLTMQGLKNDSNKSFTLYVTSSDSSVSVSGEISGSFVQKIGEFKYNSQKFFDAYMHSMTVVDSQITFVSGTSDIFDESLDKAFELTKQFE